MAIRVPGRRAVVKSAESSHQIEASRARPFERCRPVVRASEGLAAAGHYLTAVSGARVLLSGGNAFDAAAAMGFSAAVIEPTAFYSLAAEGSLMFYDARDRAVRVLSGQGVAARRATLDLFKQKGLDKIPTGPGPNAELSFTVPGNVDAMLLMLKDYGTKTLAEAVAPAMDYARRGFPMYQYMRERLIGNQIREQFKQYPPGGGDVFFPEGEPVQNGQLLVQKGLAQTLLRMVQAEAGAAGHRASGLDAAREVFYRGEIARTIVECSGRVGGLLEMEDLAAYRARVEDPVTTTFMGHEVCAQSVWTQGPVLLQALSMLERFDLRSMGHNSPQYIHTVAEAVNLAFSDRERYYGDPEFTTVPVDGLLSKKYAAERAGLIDGGRAWGEPPPAGDPWRYSSASRPGAVAAAALPPAGGGDGGGGEDGGTTHFAVIDRDGNMVVATPSGGRLDDSVFFPELGCTLSTRSEMFVLEPDHPNVIAPGKRPRTTLVNYIVCKDGEPVMTLGCPGGDAQAQANLQLLLNVMVFGMDPQEAVEAPRFTSQSTVNSFYPRAYLPGQLTVEPGIPPDVQSRLTELGHKVRQGTHGCGIGAIVTQRDPRSGTIAAGVDPRRPTYAVGY